MRPVLLVAVLLSPAALLAPAAARAQPTLGARLGFSPALGSVAEHVPMSEAMRSQIPLQLEALWRIGRAAAGVYASYGIGQVSASTCGAGASCSASDLRAGMEGTYALEPFHGAAPWGGAGLGYEWARQRRTRAGTDTTWTWRGLEAVLQGGAEWPIDRRFSVGPFAAVTFGRYADAAVDTSASSGSAPIATKALHLWVHVGVRGRLDL